MSENETTETSGTNQTKITPILITPAPPQLHRVAFKTPTLQKSPNIYSLKP